MPDERMKRQVEAIEALAAESRALSEAIAETPVIQGLQTQAKSLRAAFKWLLAITIAMFLVLGGVFYLAAEQRQDAKTNCLNNNEARAANLVLWDLILKRSKSSNEERTQKEKAFAKDFEVWVHQLYSPRDCDNLGKKYEIPPPPRIQ